MTTLDLVIKGGLVYDGTGSAPRNADVGVKDGRITEIGKVTTNARNSLDADGAIVTPGFVDIHTHYDGLATWSNQLSPSNEHGVTTVVMGNCGVGFAPCRQADHSRLIELMEGVEDIPGTALAEGMSWDWLGVCLILCLTECLTIFQVSPLARTRTWPPENSVKNA